MKKIFKKNQIIITALALMIAVAGYLQYTGTKINDKSAAKEAGLELTDDSYEISDEDVYSAEDIFTDTEDNGEAVADNTKDNAGAQADSGEGTKNAETAAADPAAAGGIETAAEAGEKAAAEGAAAGSETASTDGAEAPEGENPAEGIENPGEAVLTSSNVENIEFAAEAKLNREQIRSKNKESLLEIINNASISEEQKLNAVDAMIKLTDVAEREAASEMLLESKGFTEVVVSITDDSADVVLNMGEVTDAKRAQVEDIVKRKTNIAAENIVITPIQATTESK